MFTRKKIALPDLYLDWEKDGNAFKKAIVEYLQSLEQPGALAIVEYESWTPVLTFVTPGDLSVTYSTQLGRVQRIGNIAIAQFSVATSAFTHTTAAGTMFLYGLPYVAKSDAGLYNTGSLIFRGITKAGYTNFVPIISPSLSAISVTASATALAASAVAAADMPTGGSVALIGTITYVIE